MPVATFTYSSNGDTARFNTPTPTNNSGFYWTFGDGGTSSAQNPTHIYADTGTYTVCLFLSDSCGTDTLCQDISICDALFSDFTPNYILSGGNSVYFTNSSTGATSWIWNFDDGSTSTDFNPTHNFPSPGTYWVCLFNFNACGSDTFCDSVAVFPTGIKTSRINRDIQFINPNQNGNFAIRNKLSEDLQLKIINLEGKLTFNTTLGLGLAEFDFNYFPKGLYVLEIVNHQNEKIWTQKWIR